jgi:hypothetical protein
MSIAIVAPPNRQVLLNSNRQSSLSQFHEISEWSPWSFAIHLIGEL